MGRERRRKGVGEKERERERERERLRVKEKGEKKKRGEKGWMSPSTGTYICIGLRGRTCTSIYIREVS